MQPRLRDSARIPLLKAELGSLLRDAALVSRLDERRIQFGEFAKDRFRVCAWILLHQTDPERTELLDEFAGLARTFGFKSGSVQRVIRHLAKDPDEDVKVKAMQLATSNPDWFCFTPSEVEATVKSVKPILKRREVLEGLIDYAQNHGDNMLKIITSLLVVDAMSNDDFGATPGDKFCRFMVSLPSDAFELIGGAMTKAIQLKLSEAREAVKRMPGITVFFEPKFQAIIWVAGKRRLLGLALIMEEILTHNRSVTEGIDAKLIESAGGVKLLDTNAILTTALSDMGVSDSNGTPYSSGQVNPESLM